MATLYITEYAEISIGLADRIAWFPMEPPVADGMPVTITSSAANYGPLQENTQVVRLSTDTACHVVFSSTGMHASKNNQFMPANTEIYRGVRRGTKLFISVVGSGGGTPSTDAQPLGMP